MSDDVRSQLQRAAAGAPNPEDRAWAAAKYQEMFGRPAVDEGVPEKLKRAPLDPMDAALQQREQKDSQQPAAPQEEERGLLGRALTSLDGTPVHAFMDRANDAFTGGAWPAITGMLGIDTPESRDKLARDNPTAASLGTGTGYGASAIVGPGAITAKALSSGAARVAPGLMKQAQGKLGMGALSGGLMGAAEGGSRTGTLEGTLDGFGGGAAIGAATAAAPMAVQAGRDVAQKIPMVKKYAQAQEAGRIPAAEALPKGQEGVTRASEQARDQILSRKTELKGQAQGEYKAAIDPELGKPADVAAIQEGLAKLRAGNIVPATGEVVDEALERQIAALTKKMGDSPDIDSVLLLRKSLKQAAGFKNPSPTPDQLAARQLYKAFKKGAQNASPVVKEADAAFASAKANESKVDQVLGSKRGVDTGDESSMRRAAGELEHVGNESVPAFQRQPGFDKLRKLDPAYDDALAQLEAKRALEATRLGTLTPGSRTSLTPGVEHFGGLPLQMGLQYGRGIARAADQGLRRMQPAAEMAPRLNLSLIDALIARRQREEQNK